MFICLVMNSDDPRFPKWYSIGVFDTIEEANTSRIKWMENNNYPDVDIAITLNWT